MVTASTLHIIPDSFCIQVNGLLEQKFEDELACGWIYHGLLFEVTKSLLLQFANISVCYSSFEIYMSPITKCVLVRVCVQLIVERKLLQ